MKTNNKSRRRNNGMITSLVLTLALITSVMFSFRIVAKSINKNCYYVPEGKYSYYTNVTIKAGDTLWDIAKELKTKYDMKEVSTKAIVIKIEHINHIDSNHITSGDMVIIPYYTDEYY